MNMASKMFKQTDVMEVDMGSSGGQIRIGKFVPIDAQLSAAYLNNMKVTVLLQNGMAEISPILAEGGIVGFLTTNDAWNNDHCIDHDSAGGWTGTLRLAAKRSVHQNSEVQDGIDGAVYLYLEATDITVSVDVEIRVAITYWGSFVKFESDW